MRGDTFTGLVVGAVLLAVVYAAAAGCSPVPDVRFHGTVHVRCVDVKYITEDWYVLELEDGNLISVQIVERAGPQVAAIP